MVVKKGFVVTALAVAVVMTLSGCSKMSKHNRNTAIGAGAGAVGGGIIGHQID